MPFLNISVGLPFLTPTRSGIFDFDWKFCAKTAFGIFTAAAITAAPVAIVFKNILL
jgi:hypothetical protein